MDIDRYTVLGFFAVIVAPIVLVLTLLVVAVDVDISFKNPFRSSGKWMSSKDLVDKETDLNDPKAKALMAAFDKDNGSVYCIPKMSDAELGEFHVKLPGLLVGNAITGFLAGEYNQEKPMESVLRMAFTKSYPCK